MRTQETVIPMRSLAALFALALLVIGAAPASAEEGAITGAIPRSGVALVLWGGGPPSLAKDAAARGGCDLSSLFVSKSGTLHTYVPGAPTFVNAEFIDRVGASIPAGTAAIFVCSGNTPTPTAPTIPQPTPSPTPTPTAPPVPNEAGSPFRFSGALAPFDSASYVVTVAVASDGPTTETLRRIELCFGTVSTLGDCADLPVQIGIQRYRDLLPRVGIDGFVRLRVCSSVGCSGTPRLGVLSIEARSAFYVATINGAATTSFLVYSNLPDAQQALVTLPDGQSVVATCPGTGRCTQVTLPSTPTTATVKVTYADGATHSHSFNVR